MSDRNIVLAVDPLSEESQKTVEWTMENFLRASDHIDLVLVLILDVEFSESELGTVAIDNLKLLEEETVKKHTEHLTEIASQMKSKGFKNITTHVFKTIASKACDVLIEFVDTNPANCLVMGSRNLVGWKRFFMGSFSDYVQSRIHIPVLIVR